MRSESSTPKDGEETAGVPVDGSEHERRDQHEAEKVLLRFFSILLHISESKSNGGAKHEGT